MCLRSRSTTAHLKDLSKNGKDGLDFAAALELLLNMRGGNAATVP